MLLQGMWKVFVQFMTNVWQKIFWKWQCYRQYCCFITYCFLQFKFNPYISFFKIWAIKKTFVLMGIKIHTNQVGKLSSLFSLWILAAKWFLLIHSQKLEVIFQLNHLQNLGLNQACTTQKSRTAKLINVNLPQVANVYYVSLQFVRNSGTKFIIMWRTGFCNIFCNKESSRRPCEKLPRAAWDPLAICCAGEF